MDDSDAYLSDPIHGLVLRRWVSVMCEREGEKEVTKTLFQRSALCAPEQKSKHLPLYQNLFTNVGSPLES